MRPTRAGVGLLVTIVVCMIAGRVLGLLELYVFGAMAAAAVGFAALYTIMARVDVAVRRTATPSRLRAGSPARIDLILQNQSRRRTPVMSAHDSVQGAHGATLLLAPLKSGLQAHIAYRLPSSRRGALTVGPLDLTLVDPLGLTKSKIRAASVTTLMVHAQLHELPPLTAAAGQDPTTDQQPRRALASSGDEFFALRPYVVGDALKSVNWRASSRSEDLVVRQEERPKTGRVTVLFDRREEVYDPEAFERAVSAALSVLYSGFRGGDALRFVTSANNTATELKTRGDLSAIDEQMALVDMIKSGSLVNSLEDQTKLSKGGTLVVVTGVVQEQTKMALARAVKAFGQVVVVSCVNQGAELPPGTVLHDGQRDFLMAWSQVIQNSWPLTSVHSSSNQRRLQ